ncbi:hypothetical protein O3W44_22815 [Pantoea sp. LMR881]|uniref:hypothetical protein n=1 Tax=Pantoea sp. LMR881 TaxID=3014336 RepID=UPI0022AEA3CC|nr:hypothetical protein [Pantoea sp. LMR881]MCZ4061367.1 hypothetical protein [Pantoea sp. LMR881]
MSNKTDSEVALALYSTLISDAQYAYMLMEPITLVAGEVENRRFSEAVRRNSELPWRLITKLNFFQ